MASYPMLCVLWMGKYPENLDIRVLAFLKNAIFRGDVATILVLNWYLYNQILQQCEGLHPKGSLLPRDRTR